jgi:transcriptional antiterminator RfaH
MAFWCCAQLDPHRERLALHCLRELAGFEVYSPRIKPPRSRMSSPSKPKESTRPLFPGYAFVRIELQWSAARWSPGVTRIVLDGNVPARVPDGVIAELRSRERDGVIELPERRLVRGRLVRILRGPFRHLEGLVAGLAPHERVAILLGTLGRVTLPRGDVEAI